MEQEAGKGKRGEGRERKRKCEEGSDAGVPQFCLEFFVTTLLQCIDFPSLSHIYSRGYQLWGLMLSPDQNSAQCEINREM